VQVDDEALARLPKVELHVHLEGTISAAIAAELAARHGTGIEPLGLENGDYPRRYRDFDHFVKVFLAASHQVRTPDDLSTIGAAFARAQAAQGVRWSEATFTAVTLARAGLDPAAMWRALVDGFAEVPATAIGLIVDTPRDLGVDAAEQTVAMVSIADAPIVALGLTGIEGSVPEAEFVGLRRAADTLGIGLVVHAGETGTPDNIRAALDDLGADRIGHGIAAARDPALVDRLVRDGTVLEVCPSSNVSLGLVADLDAHPLPALYDAGVQVTVNSDDPPFFSTTLTDELRHAVRLCGLDRAGLAGLERRAAEASFAPAALRTEILAAIAAWEYAARED
jgi:aminodeoxyfutalosine deaminase